MQVFLFRTVVRHLPCLVLATTNTATSNRPPAYLYLYISFSPAPFWFSFKAGGHWLESILVRFRFSPCFASCRTAHCTWLAIWQSVGYLKLPPTQSEFGDLTVEIPRCVLFNCLTYYHGFFTFFFRWLGSASSFLLFQSHFYLRLQVTDISTPSPSLSFPMTRFSDFRNTSLVLPSAFCRLFRYTDTHPVHSLILLSVYHVHPSFPLLV